MALLTKERLRNAGACGKGYRWFCKEFPEGTELINVINHPDVELHVLNWGFQHFAATEEEYEAYIKRVGYINCGDYLKTIYNCEHIDNCQFIGSSKQIKNSSYVFDSEDVVNSSSILNSKNIENSSQIFDSQFCFNSRQVCDSRNVTDSSNIVKSVYVNNSNDIIGGSVIVDSNYCANYFS
jgi:hypothetical protein